MKLRVRERLVHLIKKKNHQDFLIISFPSMELRVSLIESMTVKPCEETKGQVIELSGLDRISPAILHTVFFYKASCTEQQQLSDGNDHFERAKRALRKVLVSWFPAAGRLRINEATGKLEIECNGKGVVMITAMTDSKLEELGYLNEYKSCYEKLVPQLPSSVDISENPLVVIQITRFACGGFAVGFGGSHSLFDGEGAFQFLVSWAHISSGKDESQLILPKHSREGLLNSLSPPNSTPVVGSIYEQSHIAAIQDLYGIPMQAIASDDSSWETALSSFSGLKSQGGLELITLPMKKEVVDKLKTLAIESGRLSRCSTFDVLCAHTWKARVKSLRLHPNTSICLQFPVNSRKRLQPQLGTTFTGNAFVLASVSCTAKDLMHEPLHYTVGRIQAAKDIVTDEYVKLYATALESTDKFFPSMRELTVVTDWTKFPTHALDFGWGKVSGLSLLATPVPETAYLLADHEEPGVVLVRMGIVSELAVDLINNFTDIGY